jgi:two-component system LytT family response regulator
MIKAVIVDDEPLAIKELQFLLASYNNIQIVGNARTVNQASELIVKSLPDVVFLDIQLRHESGFDLLHLIPRSCKIVFVTAYDKFAVDAFDVYAIDYLLKPIKEERLNRTVNRLQEIINSDTHEVNSELLKLSMKDKLFINSGNTFKIVRMNEIKAIKADGDYTCVVTINNSKHLILRTLKKWEQMLPSEYFLRIHRSTIINIEFVERIEKWFNNTCRVWMKDMKDEFKISQRYLKNFREKMTC